MVNLDAMVAPSFYSLAWDIVEHHHSNYWLKGGRGSTKSSFVSLMIVLGIMADQSHEANAVVMRRYATNLRESVYDQYLWAIDKLGVSEFWVDSVSPMQLTYVPTGQQIRFKGADDPHKVKSQKFRHGYTKYKHYEEVADFKGWTEIRNINQSLNRGGDGIVTFYSYNPPASVSSWVNQAQTQQGLRADTLVHSSDYRSVPKEWLGKEFLADAEQLKKDNPKAYAHEYLGEVTGTGAEVFNNLTIREITDEEISHFDKIYHGMDFGFAHDPLAYGDAYWDSARRRIFLFNEIYSVGMTNREAVAQIKKLNPMNEVITADSAEPRTIREFRDLGLNVVGARKGPGSREHGFKWLQDLREIVIDPVRCPNTAREFSGYELARDANGNFKSGYPDGDDHTIDKTRYELESLMKKGGFVPWK
ncbi:PBSX family phage terminase large subunit [Levilactobacillus namurensis]|uniref:PBSX family phage terminase large subunit n=1 Tax=Levilactobacillus namurensis TaxID=380393 RepID=A0AAW8WAD8_9LACO|nr:PBSX family phage terminase large subunit [Levilactobacillus namurensis]MDT7015334.1 PBSX family phage terminase large subunit [Levilactobacillus namurensis]